MSGGRTPEVSSDVIAAASTVTTAFTALEKPCASAVYVPGV